MPPANIPTRLGLTWNGRISFVLTEKLHIKRVEFLEMTKDTADGGEVDKDEQFDIDFTVMAGELAKMLDDLMQALGGDESASASPNTSSNTSNTDPARPRAVAAA